MAPVAAAADFGRLRFSKDLAWNVLGNGLPLLAGLVAVPTLVEALGATRFGLLSLAWMFVGYFGLFDLGLSRATTHLVAHCRAADEQRRIPVLVSTALLSMTALGVCAAAIVWALSGDVVARALDTPPELSAEITAALETLALSLPFVIGATGLRGVLEGYQRFDVVNVVRAPMAALSYLGPVTVLPFSTSLEHLVAVVVATRLLSWLVYLAACVRLVPGLGLGAGLSGCELRALLSYGGWITVSNIVGPVLLYLGRVLVAVLVSAEAVAYFATPYDVVINLLLIPSIFVTVLFPAWSRVLGFDFAAARMLYRRSLVWLFAAMLPLTVAVILLAAPFLEWWINEEFADNGTRVAQWLAVGIFINSFGHISQALVQAYGRPDLTAKLHVLELVAYAPYTWWLIERFGIEGAAMAWVVRVTVSTVVLGVLAEKCLNGSLASGSRAR